MNNIFDIVISTIMVGFIVSVLGIVIISITISIPYETGSGNQVGYISATETSGIIFKSGRIYVKPTLESTQEDTYCVLKEDKDLLTKLQEYSEKKANVKIYHKSWLSTGLKCGHEDALIYKVEEMK